MTKTGKCPSCGQKKASAAKSKDGLCDECRGCNGKSRKNSDKYEKFETL